VHPYEDVIPGFAVADQLRLNRVADGNAGAAFHVMRQQPALMRCRSGRHNERGLSTESISIKILLLAITWVIRLFFGSDLAVYGILLSFRILRRKGEYE
jgi:hypothetical protein